MMIIDDLITRYSAKEEFFTVTLPDGEELKFRYLTDYADIKRIQDGAVEFTRRIQKGEGILPDWKEYITDNMDTLATVYILSQTIVSPELSQLDLLKLAKKAGYIYSYIVNQYNAKETQHIVKHELAVVEDLKND